MRKSLSDRLFVHRRIDVNGCWIWTGTVYREKRGKLIWEWARISVGGRRVIVPRAAAHAFKGFDLNDKRRVCHTCDTTLCFNPEHLWYGTQGDNMKDCYAKGRRSSIGSRNGNAKLTIEQVQEIRKSQEWAKVLAPRYGVCKATIWRIRAGERWSTT